MEKVTRVRFGEALEKASFGIFHYFLILISGVLMVSLFYELMSVNFSLPVAECDLNVTSKVQYGFVSGSWFAGVILTSHLWGLLSDLYGRRRILTVTPIFAFFTSVASSFAINYWMLAIFRFLNGVCIASAGAVVFAYLGEFLTTRHRSRSIMIASTIFSVLSMLLPLIAYLIINQSWRYQIPFTNFTYKPWRLFMLVCGVPNLVCGISIYFFPESPKFLFSKGYTQRTIKILAQIHKINTRKSDYEVTHIIPDDDSMQTPFQNGVLRMMLHNTVQILKTYPRSFWLISIVQFGTFYVGHGMLLFFPDILNEVSRFDGNTDLQLCDIVRNVIDERSRQQATNATMRECVDQLDSSAYIYVMLLQACYAVGFILISFSVNHIGRLPIFAFLFFSTGLCGTLIFYVRSAMVGTYLYLWLLASGVASNLMNTVTYDSFPTHLRSMAISTTMLFGRLGGLAGGNVASFLLEDNCNWTFAVGGLLLVFCGVLVLFIPAVMKKGAHN